MRAAVSFVVVVLVARASADPCKTMEPTLRTITRELNALAGHAADAVFQCAYHGADSKLADKLLAEGKQVAADEQAVTKLSSCAVSPSGLTAVGFVTNQEAWAGERLNAATAMCAPKQPRAAASGDGCASFETFTRQLATDFEQAASSASDLAVSCAVNGADDAGLDKLAHVTNKRLADHIAVLPKGKACHLDPSSPQQLSEDEGKAGGTRIGFAFVMCSSVARKRVGELAKAGKVTPDDIGKDATISGVLAKYMGELLPSSMQ